MSRFGFKEIDITNWLEQDFIMKAFVRIDSQNGTIQMEGEDWVSVILEPELEESVPENVQALFEVARGAMVYGYFFYPLYTLAVEQLYRVAESAVHHKYLSMDASKSFRNFAKRIEWLNSQGVISDTELIRWDAIRNLRNFASHPESQSIITPANAIGTLEIVAHLINPLFKSG